MLITDYQLRQMVCLLISVNSEDYKGFDGMQEFMRAVCQGGELSIPLRDIYVVPQRVAIFASIANPRRAWLIKLLLDRPQDTAVVVDSILSGSKAIFFASLVRTKDEIGRWLDCCNQDYPIDITIKPADDEYNVLIAAASCFVKS
jgi:hypothetical protein